MLSSLLRDSSYLKSCWGEPPAAVEKVLLSIQMAYLERIAWLALPNSLGTCISNPQVTLIIAKML